MAKGLATRISKRLSIWVVDAERSSIAQGCCSMDVKNCLAISG
ncbi:Uncharacterised protein [Vibrio cholerae]|nr:Uncharacterised protein [Vibrio cholerae]CSI64471.1 Uncharacterised protein [Vibrio cholerae]